MSRVTTIRDPGNARSRRTRAALLDAARALIESGGFAALSMQAVAERAGVTRRAVYLHFATRAELVTALFDHVNAAEDLPGSLARVWAAPDAAAALEQWAAHLARFHPRIAAVDLAATRAADSDPDAARHRAQVGADQQAACRRLAGWLAADGVLAEPWTAPTAADLLWALMAPDLLTRLLYDRSWSPARYAERIGLLLRHTLLSPPPPRRRRTGKDTRS
jgi:AcrR family transcriptional regulator